MDPETTDIIPLQEDLEEFVRSILGNRLFEKKYELYDDKLHFTFRSLSGSHGELIENFKKQTELLEDYNNLLAEAGIVLRTYKINDTAFSNRPDVLTPAEIHVIFVKEFEEIYPRVTITLLCKTLYLFIKLEGVLTEMAFDSNFWKSVGRV